MEIKIATIEDADIITSIVENTITEIYPKYLSEENKPHLVTNTV